VVDGRAVKIEGNPVSENNKGKLCPKGQAGLQFLYDPDRIKGPLKRTGDRGTGQYEQISWDQALNEVADRLAQIRLDPGPHTLAFVSGRRRGSAHHIHSYWQTAYGSPNDVGHGSICEDAGPNAHMLTQSYWHYVGYDWDNVNYMISFGGSMLEAWRPTTRNLRAWGRMRGERPNRGKIVVVDVRMSITAAKADEWIPIKRGTDAAFALGLCNVIVNEGLFDEEFVRDHCHGWDAWTGDNGVEHMGWFELLDRDYSPEQVEEITGIPAATTRRIAREFATTPPALASGCRGNSMHTNGTLNRMAVHSLTALCGGIDRRGGILSQRGTPLKGLGGWAELDDIAEEGIAQRRFDLADHRTYPIAPGKVFQQMPYSIRDWKDLDLYELQAALFYYTDPLSSLPDADLVREQYMKVPFLVSFSPFWSEGAAICDYILPDDTYLERWHDDEIYPSLGFEHYAIRQPVVNRLFDTKNTFEVLFELGRRIPGMAAHFPARFKTAEDIIKYRTEGIQEAGTGNITAATHNEWWEEFKQVGVWQNPPYVFADEDGGWDRVFASHAPNWWGSTPSGKFQFYSETMETFFRNFTDGTDEDLRDLLDELGITNFQNLDEVFMPHHEPPRQTGDPNQFPFQLIHYKTMPHAEGRGYSAPWLQEIYGHHVGKKWGVWVELNPDDAAREGISNGDLVTIQSQVHRAFEGESPREAEITLPAVLYPGIQPGMVAIPFEPGQFKNVPRNPETGESVARWSDVAVNVNKIVTPENDRMSGTSGWHSTRVKINKA
jgi:anaerobic selenocysteine-containing dehydrogenase